MQLLVGLGNPGAKYAGTRHNIGFMALDAIASEQGFGPWRSKFQAEIAEGRIAGEKILLVKPQTFMNESGRAVGEAARFHKVPPTDVIVFHDELDLAPGKIRVKEGGGHAGHNGLRSIHAHIGADYHRVRMGIGHPGDKSRVSGYVLHDFAVADRIWLTPVLEAIARAVPGLVRGDNAAFLNSIGLALQPLKPAKPKLSQARPTPASEAPATEEPPRSPLERLADHFRRR
ncbi:MAG: aminoacyl-tRNA hydrolase [Pseudomonadota bacterium]